MRTDKEILDYLETFDCVHVEATHDIMEQFPRFIAMGDKFTGPGIRQALSDAMDKEGK